MKILNHLRCLGHSIGASSAAGLLTEYYIKVHCLYYILPHMVFITLNKWLKSMQEWHQYIAAAIDSWRKFSQYNWLGVLYNFCNTNFIIVSMENICLVWIELRYGWQLCMQFYNVNTYKSCRTQMMTVRLQQNLLAMRVTHTFAISNVMLHRRQWHCHRSTAEELQQ